MRGATCPHQSDHQFQRNFNPHSPCGERRGFSAPSSASFSISIHTPHAGSDNFVTGTLPMVSISIHTPHAGSDDVVGKNLVLGIVISIHTPHAGSDLSLYLGIRNLTEFQSTLPMRGATPFTRWAAMQATYFNPHSPCGERLECVNSISSSVSISIHTPHAGSDGLWHRKPGRWRRFQSTLPMRGATPKTRFYTAVDIFQSTLPMRGATLIISVSVRR